MLNQRDKAHMRKLIFVIRSNNSDTKYIVKDYKCLCRELEKVEIPYGKPASHGYPYENIISLR
jgi:hypothetical protein